MPSHDFGHLRQYRPSQDRNIQSSSDTLDRHVQGQGSGSYYYQPSTAGISYPANSHHQQYTQSRPVDNSNSHSYGSQWYDNTQVGTTPSQVRGTGAAENIQVTGDQDNAGRQAAEVLSYDMSALGSLAYASGLQFSETGTGRAAQTTVDEQFRGALPVVAHTQGQSAVQTHYQAQAPNEQTRAMRGLANQYLHTSRQAQQPDIDTYHPQQKHDHTIVHSSTSGQNTTYTSHALRQNQHSDPTAHGQRSHQVSGIEPSRVAAPTSSAQQHRQIDPRAPPSSTWANAIQHEQRPQSPLPSTPTTVNPSHVYNPYHEYRRQIEAAEAVEAERAKQATLYSTNTNIASNIQEHQHLVTERTGWSSTLEAQNAISAAIPNSPNRAPAESQIGETGAQKTANDDTEGLRKKEMIQKMMQLMQEDPSIFNQAVEQVKNASPHIASPSQTEQQRIVDRIPSQGPLSRTQGKTATKAKSPAKPRIRSKKAANAGVAKEPQAELSGLTKATLGSALTGSHLQHPGSLLPPPSSITRSLKSTHRPSLGPPVSQASSSTGAGSVPSLLSGPTSHQAPGTATAQYPGYMQPHHPKSTQDPPSATMPIQSHNVSAQTYATPPGRATSVWTESKKEALGVNAVRFLSSVPENSGRGITTQQICTILDRNPNYEELCENIEMMGFRLDRVRFAKALLAAVPDSDPTASLQTREPLPAKDIVQSNSEMPPPAINDSHQHNTHAHVTTTGLNAITQNTGAAHLSSGPIVAPPLTPNGETSCLADKRRGRGRPRTNKSTAQARSETTSQHLKKSDGNSVALEMRSGPGDALGLIGTNRNVQTSSVHSEIQGVRQGNGNTRLCSQDNCDQLIGNTANTVGSFTPLNGVGMQQEVEAVDGPATAAPEIVKSKSNESEGSVIDKCLHSSLGRSGPPLKAALKESLRTAANFPGFSPSPLLSAPTLLTAREPPPPHRASLADIEHLMRDPYDLEPELPDHLGYLERHRGSHSQATATNEPTTSKTASMLSSRAGSGTSTPKSTTAPALQTRVNRKSARLREAFSVNPRLRSCAGKYPAYNPKRISHDVLIAIGKHPTTRPLNAHAERLRAKAARVQKRAKLSAVYWAAIDQGPLPPGLRKLANGGVMTTERMDATSNGLKAIAQQLPNTLEAAKVSNETPANTSGPHPRSTRLPANNTNSPKRGRSPSSSSSSGAVLVSLRNTNTPSDQEAGQENRSSLVRAGRGNDLSGNTEQHGSSTPARPSGLRNEIIPSISPSVVIRSRSPSVLAEYTPFARRRASFVTPTSPARDPGPSGYIVFKCEWLKCKAELHNFDTLRRHVTVVHRKQINDVYQCHWSGCEELVECRGDNGESSLIKKPADFSHADSWDAHMEECHLAPVKSTLGLGPRAGPMNNHISGLPHQFLNDTEGRQLMPFASFTAWRGKNATEPAGSSPSGTGSRRLPAFLTKKPTPDAELTPKERDKRRRATVAYGNMLKRQRDLGPTIRPLFNLFAENGNMGATIMGENLRIVVKGDYDPMQFMIDRNKAKQNKVSSQLEEGITDKGKEGQTTASDGGILDKDMEDQ
ncbi:MAG: hypothetical protein M1840_004217 [Geoglossum simile]|nr:MAG: hypothetical protein M1840_004217 [Geoglossum simile]